MKTIKKFSVIVAISSFLLAPLAFAQEELAQPDEADTESDEAETESDEAEINTEIAGDSSEWKFGLAPRVGLDIPTSKLKPFVVAALEFDVFLPVLNNKLVLAIDVSFTYPRYEGSGNDPQVGGDYDYEVKVLQLKTALDVIYRIFDDTRTVVPFAGAGFIFQYLRTLQTTSFEPSENVEYGPAFGFEILGGVDFRLGPGALVGDVRFAFTNMDHKFTGDSNAGNVTICVGYRFIF